MHDNAGRKGRLHISQATRYRLSNALLVVAALGLAAVAGLQLWQRDHPQASLYRPLQAANSMLGLARSTPAPTLPSGKAITPLPAPSPMPTVASRRLAVGQSLYGPYERYFESLPTRFENLVTVPFSDSATFCDIGARPQADWTLAWAAGTPNGALLLREEPFAVAVHPLTPRDGVTQAQLAALASGKDKSLRLVSGNEKVVQELLGPGTVVTASLQVGDWVRARDYVATHEGTWALLPWEVVDTRVKLLPVNGRRLDPRALAGYPLVRRLWLSGDQPVLPALWDDLSAALPYEPPTTLELVAVGDIMLARSVGQTMQQKGMDYPFLGQGVQPLLAGADIALGNLECVLSSLGKAQAKSYTFRADPKAVTGLTYAGFDVLGLANNYTGDYADVALTDTLRILGEAHIATVGAGHSISEAHEAKVLVLNGLRIAFLAYNQIPPDSFAAMATSPGSAFTNPTRMAADVRAARQKADLVVVMCHWGVEYSAYRSASQAQLGKSLTEAGAAMVIGHHPHVAQGVGLEGNTPIVYSLGNFVFDMAPGPTSEGLILRCLLDPSGVKSLELVPVSIEAGQPRVAPPADAARVLQRVWRVSREQRLLSR